MTSRARPSQILSSQVGSIWISRRRQPFFVLSLLYQSVAVSEDAWSCGKTNESHLDGCRLSRAAIIPASSETGLLARLEPQARHLASLSKKSCVYASPTPKGCPSRFLPLYKPSLRQVITKTEPYQELCSATLLSQVHHYSLLEQSISSHT